MDHMGGYASGDDGVGVDAGKQNQSYHCNHQCRVARHCSLHLQPPNSPCAVGVGGYLERLVRWCPTSTNSHSAAAVG